MNPKPKWRKNSPLSALSSWAQSIEHKGSPLDEKRVCFFFNLSPASNMSAHVVISAAAHINVLSNSLSSFKRLFSCCFNIYHSFPYVLTGLRASLSKCFRSTYGPVLWYYAFFFTNSYDFILQIRSSRCVSAFILDTTVFQSHCSSVGS